MCYGYAPYCMGKRTGRLKTELEVAYDLQKESFMWQKLFTENEWRQMPEREERYRFLLRIRTH